MTTNDAGIVRVGTESNAGWLSLSPRFLLFGCALALGLAGRLICGWGGPLWFDETFSATIATQPDFPHLVDWCRHELTGPAYYMPLWAWAQLAGSSDLALRLPSLLLSVSVPLLLYYKGHQDRDIRLFWAILVALWMPGLLSAGDARPYPLLFFLGCAQAMAFIAMMRAPDVRHAMLWSGISAVAILGHYHGVVITAVQGLAYFATHRRVALRTWPALAPFLPMTAWMAVHLPLVLGYATSGSTWYTVLPLKDIVTLPAQLFGSGLHGAILLLVIGYTLVRARVFSTAIGWRTLAPETMLALTGMAAVAVIFATAFVRPSFSTRYLTSAMPSILFGVALWARWTLHRPGPRDVKPAAIMVAMMAFMALGAIKFAIDRPERSVHRDFNFEQASAWIDERKPRHLIFFWDSRTGAISDRARLAEVGSFFLRRTGRPVESFTPGNARGKDMTAEINRIAGADLATGAIWIRSDDPISAHMPMLQADPRWECRNFGREMTIVLACRRPPTMPSRSTA